MPYIDPSAIAAAKRLDLFTYLQNYEPSQLVRVSGDTYCTKTHDSLIISNGKWNWFSRGIGGRSALDYLIKVQDMDFVDAVTTIIGQTAIVPSVLSFAGKNQQINLPKQTKQADNLWFCLKCPPQIHK